MADVPEQSLGFPGNIGMYQLANPLPDFWRVLFMLFQLTDLFFWIHSPVELLEEQNSDRIVGKLIRVDVIGVELMMANFLGQEVVRSS